MAANETTGRAIAGELPPGWCPQNWQSAYNLWAQLLQIIVSNDLGLNIGPDVPDVSDQGKPWLRLNANGTFDRIYAFFSGAWVSPNPVPPNSQALQIWEGTTVDLQTYDGGDANAPGDYSGPMWEVATGYEGRFPMGVGAIPGSDPAASITIGQELGSASVTLTIDQMPEHSHPPLNAGGISDGFIEHTNVSGQAYNVGGSGDAVNAATTGNAGGDDSVNILNPAKGVYFIRRTARIGYKV